MKRILCWLFRHKWVVYWPKEIRFQKGMETFRQKCCTRCSKVTRFNVQKEEKPLPPIDYNQNLVWHNYVVRSGVLGGDQEEDEMKACNKQWTETIGAELRYIPSISSHEIFEMGWQAALEWWGGRKVFGRKANYSGNIRFKNVDYRIQLMEEELGNTDGP